MTPEKKRYIIVLLITIALFASVFASVAFLNKRKIVEIDRLQENIAMDLLATETQFDLLKTLPCDRVQTSILSRELGEFGAKLAFAEENQGAKNVNVQQLKKNYSLLQVKDYLLMQELSKKCSITADFVLYFYEQDCPECIKQGHELTKMKQAYPRLRVYSFDRNLDFAVMDTFIGLYDIKDTYPSLIINNKLYQGVRDQEELETLLPNLVEQKKQDDLAEEGKQFIVDQEIYADSVKDIKLVSADTKNFIYEISTEGTDARVRVHLLYNEVAGFRFKRT